MGIQRDGLMHPGKSAFSKLDLSIQSLTERAGMSSMFVLYVSIAFFFLVAIPCGHSMRPFHAAIPCGHSMWPFHVLYMPSVDHDRHERVEYTNLP